MEGILAAPACTVTLYHEQQVAAVRKDGLYSEWFYRWHRRSAGLLRKIEGLEDEIVWSAECRRGCHCAGWRSLVRGPGQREQSTFEHEWRG